MKPGQGEKLVKDCLWFARSNHQNTFFKMKHISKIFDFFKAKQKVEKYLPTRNNPSNLLDSPLRLLPILLGIFWLGSCKPVEVLRQDSLLPMPETFVYTSADTNNMASIKWREYFKDPYLAALIDTALANNLDLKIALQRIEAARAGILAAKGTLLPTADVAFEAGLSKYGRYTMDGAGNLNTEMIDDQDIPVHLPDFFIGFQSSWEIDAWGKLRNRRRAATARFLASVEGRNFVMTNLVSEIAATYYELLALDASMRIVDENISIQGNALELVRVQKEAGVANQLAVEQFEAQLLGLRGQRIEMEQLIVENENRINFLLGRYPQPVLRSSIDLLEMSPPLQAAGVPAQLLRNRPDIRAAELELAATKADLNAAKAMFYPMVEINGLIGMQAFRPDLLVTQPASLAYGLLGGLTAPLINRKAIQAEFNAANATQLEALYAYQQAILRGYIEVHNGLVSLRNLRRSFDLKRSEAEVYSRSIATSNELFRTSRANYLEVLFAQQNALSTQLELVEMKQRELMAGVSVYRALGGGWK